MSKMRLVAVIIILAINFFIWPGNIASTSANSKNLTPAQAAERNIGTITFCESIDDDLNPIKPATTFPIGSNLVFILNLPKPNGAKSVGFVVVKVDENGKDAEFINQYQVEVDPKWKTIATGEVLFDRPGTYRVYAVDWEKYNQKDTDVAEYFAKQELSIKPYI
jgi:hypothetical protein